ncbi:hypothetical protein [Nocardioides sp. SR21]|uniref:hypothetical protein n=1 Tax=Nocardioides sp. SR21 TaxID=2919501 RepID=UPI001FAB3262|nr:hypothetical protein [Nocardioides sp. SR21]
MKKLWAAWPFWLKLTLAAAIVFLLSALGAWWTDDRSSFPSWLQGIGTVAALLAAIVAARYAAGAFILESRREQRFERAQRQAQADQVAVWYLGGIAGLPDVIRGYHIENNSSLPIYDVRVTVYVDGVAYPLPVTLEVVPPGQREMPIISPAAEVINRLEIADRTAATVAGVEGREHQSMATPLVELHFRDASNVEWIRSGLGLLRPADEDEEK